MPIKSQYKIDRYGSHDLAGWYSDIITVGEAMDISNSITPYVDVYAVDMGNFVIDNMKHDYTVIRSSRKTLSLQVRNGEILVRAPYRVSNAEIDGFVNEHRRWIEKQRERQKDEAERAEGQQKLTMEELNDLKDRARQVIPERVDYYAEKIGVTYGRIVIRCQRTRWGSCSSKGNLNFNCLLMLMPPEVLDSVVVHELCHRKEMNHSSKFYDEVYRAYPEYDKWNRWLKKNGTRYMNMLS